MNEISYNDSEKERLAEQGIKWCDIAYAKGDSEDLFADIRCDIPKGWKDHPITIHDVKRFFLTNHRVPDYYIVSIGNEMVRTELPWEKDGVRFCGSLCIKTFKKIRDLRGDISVVDDMSGKEVKFKTDKWTLLEVYNDIGSDYACFTGKCWRPIGWFDDIQETWYMDDPVIGKSAREIYGEPVV